MKQPTAPKLLVSASTPLDNEDAVTVLPLGGKRLLVGTRKVRFFDVAQPARPVGRVVNGDKSATIWTVL